MKPKYLSNFPASSFQTRSLNPVWVISILLLVGGLLSIIWALFDTRFRNLENDLTGLFCLPVSLGIALIINSRTIRSQWRLAGFWFGLTCIGQAVMLQLIDAGSNLHYQHYRPLNEIFTNLSPLIWGFLLFQTVVVIFGISSFIRQILVWVKSNLKIWQILLIAGFFFIPTATVSENVYFYIREWLFAGFIQTVNLGCVILFAFSIPKTQIQNLRLFFTKIPGGFDEDSKDESLKLGRYVLGLAIFVVVLAALLNIFSYERHPHVPDEVSYLMHARFFANGTLILPAPAVPEGFDVFLMYVVGESWYPAPPPGWSLVLAIGEFMKAVWLVNPILAGLNILLIYLLLGELYSKKIARIGVFLAAVSPWYIFLGMSFMTHQFSLTCALLATLGVVYARRTGKSIWACLGGFALGMILLVRPLEAVAMAGLLGLWSIGIGGKRLKLMGIAGLVLCSMIIAGIGLLYNAKLTGNPLEFPINSYTDTHFGKNSNALGFGPDRGMGWGLDPNPGHSPTDALINTNLNVSTLNTELFGWSIGSFLLIGFFFCFAKFQRSDYLMLAVIVVIYGLHFLYYFSGGPDFSARYWFLMFVPLIVFTARGILALTAKLKESFSEADVVLNIVILSLCLITMVNFISWRAVDKYRNFRGMRPDIRYLAERHNFGKSLVLIQGDQHPDYASAMIYNPLNLQADAPIYAWDKNSEVRKKLLKAYSDRPVWIIKGPTLTKSGYEIVDGPLTTESLLQTDAK